MPVQREAPPLLAAYQFMNPLLAEAPSVMIPAPQMEDGIVPVMAGAELINTITELEVAGEPLIQLAELVITQFTASPLISVLEEKLLLVAPLTFVPFTFH